MTAWADYAPSDFLLFSPRVYWRLFELANAELWPLALAFLVAGAAGMAALRRHPSARLRALALTLALASVSTGWFFVAGRYGDINWAADALAPGFAGLALALAVAAWQPPEMRGWRRPAGLVGRALLLYALALHPLTAPLLGRPLAGAEILGIAPDPTAIAALGLALATRLAWATALAGLLAALWLAASLVTLLTLGGPEGWVLAAVLGVAAAGALAEAVVPRPAGGVR